MLLSHIWTTSATTSATISPTLAKFWCDNKQNSYSVTFSQLTSRAQPIPPRPEYANLPWVWNGRSWIYAVRFSLYSHHSTISAATFRWWPFFIDLNGLKCSSLLPRLPKGMLHITSNLGEPRQDRHSPHLFLPSRIVWSVWRCLSTTEKFPYLMTRSPCWNRITYPRS